MFAALSTFLFPDTPEDCQEDIKRFLDAPERLDEARNSRQAREVARLACDLKPISAGAFGQIFRVETWRYGPLALKLITLKEDGTREDILNEFDLTKRMAGFAPAVYACEAVQLTEKQAMGVILMELFDGDLESLILSNPYGAYNAIEDQIPALLDGLEREGLACIDLKPKNVLYKRSDDGGVTLKLTDFDDYFCYTGGSAALRKLVMATLMSSSVQGLYDRLSSITGSNLLQVGACAELPGCALKEYIVDQLVDLKDAGFLTARDIFKEMGSMQGDPDADPLVAKYPFMAQHYAFKDLFLGEGNQAVQLIEAFMRMDPEEESSSEPEASPPRRSRRLEGRSPTPDLPRRRLTPARF